MKVGLVSERIGCREYMLCQQQCIFASTDGRVIIFTATDFVKTRAIIAINGHDIAGPHFEQHGLRLFAARLVDQEFDELATVALALVGAAIDRLSMWLSSPTTLITACPIVVCCCMPIQQ